MLFGGLRERAQVTGGNEKLQRAYFIYLHRLITSQRVNIIHQ